MQLDKLWELEIGEWMHACFHGVSDPETGKDLNIVNDPDERNHRFLEEALELVQACGCTRYDAHALVDYVFGRPVGEKFQEVMVTLTALCNAHRISIVKAALAELRRIWTKVEQIRAKQKTKPQLRFQKKEISQIGELYRRIAHLERQRDDLHKHNNELRDRAMKAEDRHRRFIQSFKDTTAADLL